MLSAATALLSALEPLTHPARMRRLAEPIIGAAAIATTLLEDGDPFAGFIGAHLAGVVGEQALLLRALGHAHHSVARRALRQLGPQMPDWPHVVSASSTLPLAMRRKLWKQWSITSTETLSRAQFDEAVAVVGERDAACLLLRLRGTDLQVVLPRYDAGVTGARSLARVHADVVATMIIDRVRAASSTAARTLVWGEMRSWWHLLSREAPAQAVAVAAQHLPPEQVWGSTAMASMIAADPVAFAALMSHRVVGEALTRQAASLPAAFARLDDKTLGTWASTTTDAALLFALRDLSIQRRRRLLISTRATAIADGSLPESLLPYAPREMAAGIARLQRAKPRVAGDPMLALGWCRYLPLAEAKPHLTKASVTSEAAVRALSLSLLASCAGRHARRDQVLEPALEQLDRIKNEQDPVRQQVLQAWALVPASRFTAACAPWLVRMAEHVSGARDTSFGTRHALHQLASRLLVAAARASDRVLVVAAITMMQKSSGVDGAITFTFRDVDVPTTVVTPLIDALRDTIGAAIDRARPDVALALASALGRRAYHNDVIDDWLWRIAKQGKTHVAGQAAELLLQAPGTRDARCEVLLDLEKTFVIVCPTLQRHLHGHRQDLLKPFIDIDKTLKGKFADAKARWCWPHHHQLWRWSPSQQQLLARMWTRAADDPKQLTTTRAHAIGVLASIPLVRAHALVPWINSTEVVVAEAALQSLSCLDHPADASPLLLQHLDSDRARVAMYALQRTLLRSPPSGTKVLLSGVLTSTAKLTAKKEALRLLGSLRIEGGVDVIAGYLGAEVHKDLRVAAGHALRQRTDDPRTQALLRTLATSADTDGPRSIASTSRAAVPPPGRAQHLALLLLCTQHADVRVRELSYQQLPQWAVDDAQAVLSTLVAAVINLDELAWGAAADGLPHLVAVPSPSWSSLSVLLTAPDGPDRDLSGLQRLRHVEGLLSSSPSSLRVGASHLRQLANQWRADERMVVAATKLDVAAIDCTDADAWRGVASAMSTAHPGVHWPSIVNEALSQASDLQRLVPVMTTLQHGAEDEAMVAVAIAALLLSHNHDTALCADALKSLRYHAAKPVRMAASHVYVHQENGRLQQPPTLSSIDYD
jgi:hypothetical protein